MSFFLYVFAFHRRKREKSLESDVHTGVRPGLWHNTNSFVEEIHLIEENESVFYKKSSTYCVITVRLGGSNTTIWYYSQ